MREWHFYDKVYRRWVVLVIGNRKQYVKFLEGTGYKNIDEDWIDGALGTCLTLDKSNNDIGNNSHILWLEKYHQPTLIHEISHLVMMIFDSIGVEISLSNTEAFAFYSEYWFNEFTNARKNHPEGLSYKKVKK